MNSDVAPALFAELLKARRSRVPWLTGGAMAMAGFVLALFMFVLQDPDRAKSLGLVGAKAQFAGGTADWAGCLALATQIAAMGGFLVFGLVVVWLFGREFSDRTFKDLLALPTRRWAIVVAKLLAAATWCLLLTCELAVMALGAGWLLHLPGWSGDVAIHGLGTLAATAILTIAVSTTYGLAASVFRGYLAAVGAIFLALVSAQVLAALGFGAWFPWAVPSLVGGLAGPDQPAIGWASIAGVVVTSALCASATVIWWERADHSR
jgi:ABC-2 type transport system permease protein